MLLPRPWKSGASPRRRAHFLSAIPKKAQALFTGAGFRDMEFRTEERDALFPSVAAFVEGVAAGAPATRHALAQLPDGGQEDFVTHVEEILEPFTGADGLTLPTRSHIVVARP